MVRLGDSLSLTAWCISRDIEGGMLIGYARTSTTEQEAGLEAQRRDLRASGCYEIFEEQRSQHKAGAFRG